MDTHPQDEQEPTGQADAGFLSQAYGDLLDHQPWETDVGDADSFVAEVNEVEATIPIMPPSPLRIIEALLFIGGPQLTAVRATETIRGLTPAQFTQSIESLNQEYRRQGRPYHIESREQGYVLTLRPRFRSVIEKLYGSTREARLSAAAIDVLALVAYRQPAAKQEIDSLRGADSGSLLRQLVRRNLITIVQRAEAGQHEVAYGTTSRFLKLFGLTSLEDLPRTQDLQLL